MARTPYDDPEAEKAYQGMSVEPRNEQIAQSTKLPPQELIPVKPWPKDVTTPRDPADKMIKRIRH